MDRWQKLKEKLTKKRLNEILEEARIATRKRKIAARKRRASFTAGVRRDEEECQERLEEANRLLKGKLRQASVEDYKNWLAGFLQEGKKPTHCYGYPMKRGLYEWQVALVDFQIAPLFGADALHIIIPNGVRFLGGKLGYSNLYFMHDFVHLGGWVPVYSDIHF